MDEIDRGMLADFYRNVILDPIDADDPRYVDLYAGSGLLDDDPVTALLDVIELTPGSSVQLLSGYRGSGKTTQLRRLKRRLEDGGRYVVFLIDVEEYLNTAVPVDISDFLIALGGAFDDAVPPFAKRSMWERVAGFLGRIRINEIELTEPLTGTKLKGSLRESTEFTARLRQATSANLLTLVTEVREFVAEAVSALLRANPDALGVVLIVDSVEHYRGTSTTEVEVQASIERLFGNHAERLQFDNLHILYTVPPYLKVKIPNVASFYEPGAKLQLVPAVKVRDSEGKPYEGGIAALTRLVTARGPAERVFGPSADGALRTLCLSSGGHLRDLLRFAQEVLLRARRTEKLPVTGDLIRSAADALARAMLPIPDNDALRLWRIHTEHDSPLDDIADLPSFARFLDTQLILAYRNGREWYDVHPLIEEDVRAQVVRIRRRGVD